MLRRLVLPLVAVALLGLVAPPAAASAPVASRHDPVLLVHGFNGSRHDWRPLVGRLEADGYRPEQIDAIDYDPDASNVVVAHEIARASAALMARTGAARVDVVSHSMGAISSRYWLERLGGAEHVDAWVSLAGVNGGTVWAYACYVLTPCREMVPTSSVLERLNHGFRAAGPTRYGAWWSPCDDAIVPHSNAELPGAHNVETACLGHTQVRTDPHVLGQVVRFLARPPARA